MKVLFGSDLHLDVNSMSTGINLLPPLIRKILDIQPDVFVIAGDISNFAEDTIAVIDLIEKQTGVKVLFVPGNHDIWVNSDESSWDSYQLFAEHSSTLIKKPFHLSDNVVIIGDMGWYDYSLIYPTHLSLSEKKMVSKKKKFWADADYALWNMSDKAVLDVSLTQLKENLDLYQDKQIIFVNHFIPYADFTVIKSNEPNWNLCNGFMGSSKIGELINSYQNISHVVFGHTHKRFGYVDFQDKKVICSPVGYVGEWKTDDFKSELDDALILVEF